MPCFSRGVVFAFLAICASTSKGVAQERKGIWQKLPPAYASSKVAFNDRGGFDLASRGGVQSIPIFRHGCVVEGSVTFHGKTGLYSDTVRLGFFTSAQRRMQHSFEVAESPAVVSFQTHHGVGRTGKINIEKWTLIDGHRSYALQLEGGRKDFQFKTEVAYLFRIRVTPSRVTVQFYHDGDKCLVIESNIDTTKAPYAHIIIYNRETDTASSFDWLRVRPLKHSAPSEKLQPAKCKSGR